MPPAGVRVLKLVLCAESQPNLSEDRGGTHHCGLGWACNGSLCSLLQVEPGLVVALVKDSLSLPSHGRDLDYKGEEILPTRLWDPGDSSNVDPGVWQEGS